MQKLDGQGPLSVQCLTDNSRKAYFKEFRKVVELADVVIQVSSLHSSICACSCATGVYREAGKAVLAGEQYARACSLALLLLASLKPAFVSKSLFLSSSLPQCAMFALKSDHPSMVCYFAMAGLGCTGPAGLQMSGRGELHPLHLTQQENYPFAEQDGWVLVKPHGPS